MPIARLAFRHRESLLVLAAAPLAWAALAAPPPGPAELAAGAAVALAGGALRLLAIRRLGKRARVRRAKADVLVVDGPYRWTRNPLYVAAVLIVAGFGLATGLGPSALAPAIAVWLCYDAVVRHEEALLLAAQGEAFEAYRAAVPRWLPWRPAPPGGAPPVPWTEVLAREWRLVLWLPLGLVAAALLPATPVRELAARAAGALGAPLGALVAVVACAAALAVAVRTRWHLERKARDRAAAAGAGGDQAPAVVGGHDDQAGW